MILEQIKSLGNIPVILEELVSLGAEKRFIELHVDCAIEERGTYIAYAEKLGIYATRSWVDSHKLRYGVFAFYPHDLVTRKSTSIILRYNKMLKNISKAEKGEYKDGKEVFADFLPFIDLVTPDDHTIKVVEGSDYYYLVDGDNDFNDYLNKELNIKYKTSVRKGKYDSEEKLLDTVKALCLEML